MLQNKFAETSKKKCSILEQRMKRCGKQPVFGIFNCVEVTGGGGRPFHFDMWYNVPLE